MIDERVFLGYPKSFQNRINIFPPKVKEVVADPEFWKYFKILTITQEEIEDELAQRIQEGDFPTPFELLLNNSYHSKEYEEIARKAFYLFTKQDILFIYEEKKILFGDLSEELQKVSSVQDLNFLEEKDYFNFQNLIREVCGVKAIEAPDPNEDPRVKRIKAKARLRDKIKKEKGMGLSLLTSMASICCMGIGITPLNIGELTYASIEILMRTYQEKEKYETDIRSIQAGADQKKINPKYWIRNLND